MAHHPWDTTFKKRPPARTGQAAHNKKFPGVEALREMLMDHGSTEIAAQLGVTPHTVTNWIIRNGLQGLSPHVRQRKPRPPGVPSDAERVAATDDGGMMAAWARRKL